MVFQHRKLKIFFLSWQKITGFFSKKKFRHFLSILPLPPEKIYTHFLSAHLSCSPNVEIFIADIPFWSLLKKPLFLPPQWDKFQIYPVFLIPHPALGTVNGMSCWCIWRRPFWRERNFLGLTNTQWALNIARWKTPKKALLCVSKVANFQATNFSQGSLFTSTYCVTFFWIYYHTLPQGRENHNSSLVKTSKKGNFYQISFCGRGQILRSLLSGQDFHFCILGFSPQTFFPLRVEREKIYIYFEPLKADALLRWPRRIKIGRERKYTHFSWEAGESNYQFWRRKKNNFDGNAWLGLWKELGEKFLSLFCSEMNSIFGLGNKTHLGTMTLNMDIYETFDLFNLHNGNFSAVALYF